MNVIRLQNRQNGRALDLVHCYVYHNRRILFQPILQLAFSVSEVIGCALYPVLGVANYLPLESPLVVSERLLLVGT